MLTSASLTLRLGVTDTKWYNFLSQENLEDVNFWQPGGFFPIKRLRLGEPFLFKLRSPFNAIGGLGFFLRHIPLQISMAWDVFGKGNGSNSFVEFQEMINKLRKDKSEFDPQIGCIVLTNPIFFKRSDWLTMPEDWKSNTQQGKYYSTETSIGLALWQQIEKLLQTYLLPAHQKTNQILIDNSLSPQYGKSILTKVRLGQSGFRILVTDAYRKKCAISGERTLPVLESAHIRPYAESGPHLISNALLLRSDLHKLFDAGYLTVTPDLKVEVSKRIKEEFENGREYYKYHGIGLTNLPNRSIDTPGMQFVEWHNTNKFKG